MLAISVAHSRALAELRTRHPDLRVVMVGAAALCHYVSLRRTTLDVDLAVVAEPVVAGSLLGELGWSHAEKDPPHRWRKKDEQAPGVDRDIMVDFLPATEEILRLGEFRPAPDREVMSMVGFDLALRHAAEVPLLLTASTIEVAALPVLVVLKIVAWLDNPSRGRDLGDIAEVLTYALPPDDLRRWDAGHPVGSSDLVHDDQSAFFVGHEVGLIIEPRHLEWVERFLSKVEDPDGVPFAQMLCEGHYLGDDRDARLTGQLRAFRLGLDTHQK